MDSRTSEGIKFKLFFSKIKPLLQKSTQLKRTFYYGNTFETGINVSHNLLDSNNTNLFDDDIFLKHVLNFLYDQDYKIKNELDKILKDLHEFCKEEGFELFSDKAKENAIQIIKFIKNHYPNYDWDIYPTEDQEIAIDCTLTNGGLLILCDSNGELAYFKTLNGKNSRYRCQDINDFPFDQLKRELNSLEDYSLKPSLVDTKIYGSIKRRVYLFAELK